MPDLTLGQKRRRFAFLKAQLILWIFEHTDWEVSESEGYVRDTDAADDDHDGPHKAGGAHYTGLGQDLNLFINGTYITNGDHTAWRYIGLHWELMDPLCRWGGRFGDANHISLFHEGRS